MTVVEEQLKQHIKKLHDNALDAGWGFTFHVGKYPIVVTFESLIKESEQIGFIPEEKLKEPQKFHLIFTPDPIIDIPDRVKIAEGQLNSFKNACKKIVLLYYFYLHRCLKEKLEDGADFFTELMENTIEAALKE